MGRAIALRDDYSAGDLRRLAKASKDADQSRRLLALAEIYTGSNAIAELMQAIVNAGAKWGHCTGVKRDHLAMPDTVLPVVPVVHRQRRNSASFNGAACFCILPLARCMRFRANLTGKDLVGLSSPAARWKVAMDAMYLRTVAGALVSAMASINATRLSGAAGRGVRPLPFHPLIE